MSRFTALLAFGVVLLAAVLEIQFRILFPEPHLEDALDSTVLVIAGAGMGSGFFITPDGCAMTAFHVIRDGLNGGKKIFLNVRGRREWLSATVVAGDDFMDMAVVCADYRPEHYLTIINSEGVSQGDHVYVVGHPLGKLWNLTDGVISRMDLKRVKMGKFWLPRYAIYTTAFILWGNSGGPLIDSRGRVIGMMVQWDNPIIGHPNGINVAVTGTDMLRFLKTVWGK